MSIWLSSLGHGADKPLVLRGNWNADTNTPALSDSGGGGELGDFLVVTVPGTTAIDGISDWGTGDWIVNAGTYWFKQDNSESIQTFDSIYNNQPGVIRAIAVDDFNIQYNLSDTKLFNFANAAGELKLSIDNTALLPRTATTLAGVINKLNLDTKGLANDGSDNFNWQLASEKYISLFDITLADNNTKFEGKRLTITEDHYIGGQIGIGLFFDNSGVGIYGSDHKFEMSTGSTRYKDAFLTTYMNFSEIGVTALTGRNSKTSLVGVINELNIATTGLLKSTNNFYWDMPDVTSKWRIRGTDTSSYLELLFNQLDASECFALHHNESYFFQIVSHNGSGSLPAGYNILSDTMLYFSDSNIWQLALSESGVTALTGSGTKTSLIGVINDLNARITALEP